VARGSGTGWCIYGSRWTARLVGKRILHFAPEKQFVRRMYGHPLYETADLHQPGVRAGTGDTSVGLLIASDR